MNCQTSTSIFLIISTTINIYIDIEFRSFSLIFLARSLTRSLSFRRVSGWILFVYSNVVVMTVATVRTTITTDRNDNTAALLLFWLLYSFNASLYSTAAIRTQEDGASVELESGRTSGPTRFDCFSVAHSSGTVEQQSK